MPFAKHATMTANYGWGAATNVEYDPIYQPLYPSTHPRDGGVIQEERLAKDNLTDAHLPNVGVLFSTRPNLGDRRRYNLLCRRINEQDMVTRQLQNNVAVLERAHEANDRQMINLLYSVLPGDFWESYFPLSTRARQLRMLAEFDVIALQEQVRSLELRVINAEAKAERAEQLSQHVSSETFRHPTIVRQDIFRASEPNPLIANSRAVLRSVQLPRGPQDDDELLTEGTIPPS